MLFVTIAQQGHAVLKEKDLGQTLHVLRLELYHKWNRQKELMKQMEERSKRQHEQLIDIIKRTETTSLILYSQGQDFTFDMAYACQEATTLYQELKGSTMPFDQIKAYIETEIASYDSLIYSLKQLPPALTTSPDDFEENIAAIINVAGGADGDDDEEGDASPFMLDE